MESTLVKPWSGEVKAKLIDSLPWSPLDFITGVSPAGDRSVHVESLVRDLDPGDDLRLSHPLDDESEVAVCAERLAWDSSFFGYGVARLHGIFPLKPCYAYDADYTPALRALIHAAKQRGIRYLFAVIDARDLPTQRALSALGFALLETRVYFSVSLRDYHFPRRFRCRSATADDLDSLSELARSIENPFDRFNADPFIPKSETLRLMDTWLRASVLNGYADLTFVNDAPRPSAVCTVKYHYDKHAIWERSVAQLVLAMAGRGGRFLGVISEINYLLKERGFDHVFFSTQLANRSAIRVGEHVGYKMGRGEYVFRLLL